MIDPLGVAFGAFVLGGLLAAVVLGLVCVRPARRRAGLGEEVAALRLEFVDYRTTHEYDAAQIERRLDALEATTAQAANEVRMASHQLIERLPADSSAPRDRHHDHA